jgi:RNA-directed DNA polymerase
MGGWAIAQSPILGTTITKARLMKRGYISLSAMFKTITKNTEMNRLYPMV